MPFQFTPYTSPYVGSISQLMQAPAQAQAQAALTSGQAYANAAQQTGQAVSGAIQQATDPRRQFEQRQLDDMRALDKAFQMPGGRDAIINALPGHLRPSVMKQFNEADESAAKVQEATLAAEKATTDYVGGLADNIVAHNYDPSAAQLALSHAKATFRNNPSLLNQVTQIEQHIQGNPTPDGVKSVVEPIIKARDSREKGIVVPAGGTVISPSAVAGSPGGTFTAPTEPGKGDYTVNGQRFKADGTPIGAAVPKQAEPPKPGTPEDWVDRSRRLAVAQNGGRPLSDEQIAAVDAKALGEFKEINADPVLRAQAIAQKNIAQQLANAQLGMMPTKDQAASVADDLVNHRVSPSQLSTLFSTRGKEGLAFKLAVTAEAKKLDPTFNFEEAESTYSLSKSTGFQNTVRYMDSVQESMPRVLQSAQKLANGNVRGINALLNAGKNQFNDVDLKAFQTDRLLVADEVAKILQGGGSGSATSDAKLNQASEILKASDSPAAIATALTEVNALIGYRRKALTRGTYLEGSSVPKTTPEYIRDKDGKLVLKPAGD